MITNSQTARKKKETDACTVQEIIDKMTAKRKTHAA